MQSPLADALDEFAAALHAENALRVWSVVITIFGDVVYSRGGTISAATLNAITERLGISPGALRVSISRLVKEGWITRTRKGRNSFYSVSSKRQSAFGPAAHIIYAARQPVDDGLYRLVILPAAGSGKRSQVEESLRQNNLPMLATGIFLLHETAERQNQPAMLEGLEDCLVIDGEIANLPKDFKDAILPENLAGDYEKLTTGLATLEKTLVLPDGKTASGINGLDAVAARVLTVHLWRRLVLRQMDIPAGFLPQDWPGEAARKQVISLYRRLLGPSQHWLNSQFATFGAKTESAEDLLARRFVEPD